MILKIFAIRDRATDQFGTPMFLISTGQAIRSFSDEINKKEAQNLLNTHAEDYDLYELGEFNTNNATFDKLNTKQIAIGKDIKVKE